MQEPGTTQPASRFGHGEAVTILITATVDAEFDTWLGGRAVPTVSVELPGQPDFTQDVPYGLDGITVARGDILPDVIEALKTAQRFWEPSDEIPDCADCKPGALCADHAGDQAKADRFRDVLNGLTP